MIRRLLLAAAAVLLAPLGAEAGWEEIRAAGSEDRNGREVVLHASGSIFMAAWQGAGSPAAVPTAPTGADLGSFHRVWVLRTGLVETVPSGVLHRLRLLRAGHGARRLDLPPPSHD